MNNENERKQDKITDFLTQKQIDECLKYYHEFKGTKSAGTFAKIICEKIIKPNILSINNKLGQKNDPMYLAYMVEYLCNLTN